MMKKLAILMMVSLFTMCLLLIGSSPAIAKDKALLSVATASTGGSWYPAGGAIASIINKYVPGAEASAHPSAASRENIRLIEKKKSDLGMVMPDVAYFAQTGTDMYAGKPPAKIAGLFSFWGIDLLIITRASTNIYKIEDLKGKKATFATKVISVAEPKTPEVDEEFAKSFGVEDGSVETLKSDISKSNHQDVGLTSSWLLVLD